MYSQRDPSLRRTGLGNVFIKNLDSSIDNKALHDTFATFGQILSCKVATGEPNGRSLGYGFVHYATQASADQAVQHMNGMLLNDKKVLVGPYKSKEERTARVEALKARFTNVYTKNLDPTLTDPEFEQLFRPFGTITSSYLPKGNDGKTLGFGFVNFATHDQAQSAVDAMHNIEVRGMTLFVGRAQKKGEREAELRRTYDVQRSDRQQAQMQETNLYLKNLPDSFDDHHLYHLFGSFGIITSAKVMRDSTTGVSRGFGFVCFEHPDEANQAMMEMNAKLIDGRPLYVAHAQPKDVRHQHLEAVMMQRQQLQQLQQQQ